MQTLVLLFCSASDVFPVEASVDGDTRLVEGRALPGGKEDTWRRSGPARHRPRDLEQGAWSSVNQGDEVCLLVFQLWDQWGPPSVRGDEDTDGDEHRDKET